MSSSQNKETAKSPTKKVSDHTSLKAWQVGHQANLDAHAALQEYYADPASRPWCDAVSHALRDSVVQLMEAYRKYGSPAKFQRYEASLYYINQAHYALVLGQDLGIWQVPDLLASVKEYSEIVRATSFHFIDKSHKSV